MLSSKDLDQVVQALLLRVDLKKSLIDALVSEIDVSVDVKEESDYYTSYQIVSVSLTIGEHTISDSGSIS
jgi:hypothetical protein